jgi:putative hemolysin
VVLLKDLFLHFEKDNLDLQQIVKEPIYFIEHTTAYKALENFKKTKIHYALVTDEYGVFQGIITLNDILEALVGDASEFYEDDFKLIAREDGTWLVDGHYSLHDFLTYFDLDDLIGEYDVTTVSGLITTELGVIPKQGEKLIWNKLELEVIDMDGVKIDKVLVKALQE